MAATWFRRRVVDLVYDFLGEMATYGCGGGDYEKNVAKNPRFVTNSMHAFIDHAFYYML